MKGNNASNSFLNGVMFCCGWCKIGLSSSVGLYSSVGVSLLAGCTWLVNCFCSSEEEYESDDWSWNVVSVKN